MDHIDHYHNLILMFSKEKKLYLSAERNQVDNIKELLVQDYSFDIDWKNPENVNHIWDISIIL